MDDLVLRTGLIVEVPEAEPAVRSFRNRLDPLAHLGVPAHVTVLFPFVPVALIDDETVAVLRSVFAEIDSFRFVVARTGWFGQDVLWLAPHPADRFIALTGALCTPFPQYRPYGGQFTEIVPHLTVADRAPMEQMRFAEQEVRLRLPLESVAGAVTLMAEQESGHWARHSSYPLRAN